MYLTYVTYVDDSQKFAVGRHWSSLIWRKNRKEISKELDGHKKFCFEDAFSGDLGLVFVPNCKMPELKKNCPRMIWNNNLLSFPTDLPQFLIRPAYLIESIGLFDWFIKTSLFEDFGAASCYLGKYSWKLV